MSDNAKTRLHELIDALPEREVSVAQRVLTALCARPETDVDETYAQQVSAFISEYRAALETLAR